MPIALPFAIPPALQGAATILGAGATALGLWKTGEAIHEAVKAPPVAQSQNAQKKAATTGTTTSVCSTCPPPKSKCQELRDKIHEKIYGEKGEGADKKGAFQRRNEQIHGEFGPGQIRIGRKLDNNLGQLRFRNTIPWDTHEDEITRLQDNIEKLYDEYNKNNCKEDPDAQLNKSDVKRVTGEDFIPKPSDWKGPKP